MNPSNTGPFQGQRFTCGHCGCRCQIVREVLNGPNKGAKWCLDCVDAFQAFQRRKWPDLQDSPKLPWSFEASGSENDNSRGELLINGKSIELLAESQSNLIRILIAELKSHGLTAKPLEHYLQFVENERGAHDPWSLVIDQNS